MRYFKVIKDDKVIDVLKETEICYLKYSKRHERMMNAKNKSDAQAIYSSDCKYIWHVNTLLNIPTDGYDTVSLCEIDVYEYENLRLMNNMTYEEVVDSVILSLIEGGML